MELDCHLLRAVMMLPRVLVMLRMTGVSGLLTLSALVVRLAAEGPRLDGDHGGGVGVHEAGEGVDGRHGGGRGALLRRPSYPRRCGPLPGVVVERLGDELGVELLDPGPGLGARHVREGRGLGWLGVGPRVLGLGAALRGAGLAGRGGGAVL